MRCLVCGGEMRLEQVARDDSMSVPGFEHRTFMCSACGDTEQRYVFTRHEGQSRTGPAPHISPSSIFEIQSASALGFVRRVFAKLRSVCHAMKGRLVFGHGDAKPVSVPTTGQSIPTTGQSIPTTGQSIPTTGHKSAPPIAPVSAPPVELASVPKLPPASIHHAEAALVPTASSGSVSSETDKDLDECEALLRRAIEIVRGPAQSSQTTTGVAKATSETPAENVSSAPAETSLAWQVVVQIHHDSQKAKYVAKDTKSGLSVLGHQDSARLRAMCDRMGWQVVDGQ
jgi:hypothetical protein